MARSDHVIVESGDIGHVTKLLGELPNKEVLVGIPSTTAGRTDIPISNAVLGYIHEFGEPRHNIPPRPFLIPGVVSVQAQTIEGLRRAGEFALNGKETECMRQLHAVGMRASMAVKRKITTGPFVPLRPATVAARLRKTKRGRNILGMLRQKGADLAKWGAANLKPLIDTGQMRNAVTYIVRDGGKVVAKP